MYGDDENDDDVDDVWMFGCMGERDCESQGKRGPGIPLPGNLISDTRRIRIMIFVIISPPASYICTFSSTMYTIRVNLFLIDWPSVVPCTMESGESLTDTHIRSPSDSALSHHQIHQFENTLLSLSTDMCGKICTGQSPGHEKYVYTWPVAVEKSYANYGLVLPYINLHLRLQQLM